jgi:hypothetical protein
MSWQEPPIIPDDVEATLVAALAPLLDPVPVATDTVGHVKGAARVVVSLLSGVPVAQGTRASTPVNLTCWGGSKEDALDLARAAHAAILGLPDVPGSGVTAVRSTARPYPVPVPDTADGIARYVASYLVLTAGTPA